MHPIRWFAWLLTIALLAGCGASAPSAPIASALSDIEAPADGAGFESRPPTSATAGGPSTSGAAERCAPDSPVEHHDAPALESMLPTRVAGRELGTWSVAGRCWLEIQIVDDARIEELLARFGPQSSIDLAHLAQAVAGRSNVAADPPYIVF